MSLLKSWLNARDTRLRWIDFEVYARRVFANDPADWYVDATRDAATLMQAQGVIASDALILDLTAPFVTGLGARDAAQVLARLGEAAPQDFFADALAALAHRFEGRLDLVLKLQAPWDLVGGGQPDFDALDDVGIAPATCMRRLAHRPVAALLLETARVTPQSADEVDAYQPLRGAALPEVDAAVLLYGAVPADATPEVVASVARALHA